MAETPYDVAEAFVNGEHKRRGAFVSMGDAIYSYSLKLAHRESDDPALIGRIVIDTDLDAARSISNTTARHVKALRETLATLRNVEIVRA